MLHSVVVGRKSSQEKFPGAEKTLTLEALILDGKALILYFYLHIVLF